MDNSSILAFIKDNYTIIVSASLSLVFFIVNIIQAIRSHDKGKLKEALLLLPEVICQVESISKSVKMDALSKKSLAEELCYKKFGKLYQKNIKLFDDAIEDILKTPQKKGGSSDVS